MIVKVTACTVFYSNDRPTTELYTLSLHDALPISRRSSGVARRDRPCRAPVQRRQLLRALDQDRKSTRLNSSHLGISYAVFCLKKKTGPDIADGPRGL